MATLQETYACITSRVEVANEEAITPASGSRGGGPFLWSKPEDFTRADESLPYVKTYYSEVAGVW